jgi:hypothetical protein
MIFEKIRERLQKLMQQKCDLYNLGDRDEDKYFFQLYFLRQEIMPLLDKVEAEYNNGWIPCSERLPEGEDYGLAQYADGKYDLGDDDNIWMAFYNHTEGHWEYETDEGLLITPEVIAWQPLPKPYKKGE